MTVYDFMKKMGEDHPFYITLEGKDITGDVPVDLYAIKIGKETRECVLDALDKQVMNVDAVEWIIDCETGERRELAKAEAVEVNNEVYTG